MQHRPSAEHAFRHILEKAQLNIDMPIIVADPLKRVVDSTARAFEKLQEHVMAANERPGDPVALIATARIEQDPVKRGLVVPERLRRVDELECVLDRSSPSRGPAPRHLAKA